MPFLVSWCTCVFFFSVDVFAREDRSTCGDSHRTLSVRRLPTAGLSRTSSSSKLPPGRFGMIAAVGHVGLMALMTYQPAHLARSHKLVTLSRSRLPTTLLIRAFPPQPLVPYWRRPQYQRRSCLRMMVFFVAIVAGRYFWVARSSGQIGRLASPVSRATQNQKLVSHRRWIITPTLLPKSSCAHFGRAAVKRGVAFS